MVNDGDYHFQKHFWWLTWLTLVNVQRVTIFVGSWKGMPSFYFAWCSVFSACSWFNYRSQPPMKPLFREGQYLERMHQGNKTSDVRTSNGPCRPFEEITMSRLFQLTGCYFCWQRLWPRDAIHSWDPHIVLKVWLIGWLRLVGFRLIVHCGDA